MTKPAFHPEEIQAILAEESYSSGRRAQCLKTWLTELEQTPPADRDPELERLAEQVRQALTDLQSSPS